MVEFGEIKTGEILNGQFFTPVQRRSLKFKIPIKFRSADKGIEVERFLSEVANAGQVASHLMPKKTPANILKELLELADVAKKMQQITMPFSGKSESYEVLQSHFNYFAYKNLPKGTPSLSELLTRINTDLITLRGGSQYAASKITPDKSVQTKKSAARDMVSMVARAFESEFGCTPPQASWFAKFMKTVGQYASVPCGSAIVSEVVAGYLVNQSTWT